MATTTRNVFRRGGYPVRVTNLGASDPFAKMVADLHKQLGFLQDQRAIESLAKGDPDGFLKYAIPSMASRTGEDKVLWEGLIRKAENKIDEEKWAAIIKHDDSRLEEFLDHLYGKLDRVALGTSESYSLITAIDGVIKSISARDENVADQKALLSYVETKDHMAYARYLGGKLARTTDIRAAVVIQKDIEELRARQATSDRVERTKKRADIAINYLEHGLGAGAAIVQLQELALDKNITAEEVNAIQTLVSQITNEEQQRQNKRESAGGSGTGVNEAEFGKNFTDYQTARDRVDQILKDGGNPAENYPGKNISPLDELRAMGSILKEQYMASAEYKEKFGKDGSTARGNASSIDQFIGGVPQRTDANTIKNAVTSDADAFKKRIAELDPESRAKARETRLAGLSAVFNSLHTPGAQQIVRAEISELASEQRNETTQLSAKTDLKPADQKWLNDAYELYKKSVPNGVSMDRFLSAALAANKETNPDKMMQVFAEQTGVTYTPGFMGQGVDFNQFGNWQGENNGKGAKQFVVDLAELTEESHILDYRDTAMKAASALLSIPGATPFGPVGSPQYEILGLTAQDLVELRRGAGLIGNVQVPRGSGKSAKYASDEDLMSYEDSDSELTRSLRAEKDLMEQQALSVMPSIEDTILQPLVGNEFPPIDMTMFDQGAVSGEQLPMLQPEPQEDYGYPGLGAADAYLDEGVVIDIPGSELPPLPGPEPYDTTPYWDRPVRDAHDNLTELYKPLTGPGSDEWNMRDEDSKFPSPSDSDDSYDLPSSSSGSGPY